MPHNADRCNAVETLLVHKDAVDKLMPALQKAFREKQIELRATGDIADKYDTKLATEEDFETEYLDLIISAKTVTDKKEREKVDKLNQADSMIFQTENMLKESGDKLPADVKAEVEAAIEKLKTAHKAQDIAAIDAAIAELNNVAQKMYAAQQQAGPQPNPEAQDRLS